MMVGDRVGGGVVEGVTPSVRVLDGEDGGVGEWEGVPLMVPLPLPDSVPVPLPDCVHVAEPVPLPVPVPVLVSEGD